MDIRRLGHDSEIAPALLETTSAAYLAPPDRAAAHASWFEMGLTHATEAVHGIAALIAIRDQPSTGYPMGTYCMTTLINTRESLAAADTYQPQCGTP
jgi:hypothetical protein